ncbi:MAG: hypothetical protein BGO41_01240 [Clostridiales bacterium 38-18]|nr:MAG: hypothetical protein BGO41_01240 [Clostridiales bacterium 38-18]
MLQNTYSSVLKVNSWKTTDDILNAIAGIGSLILSFALLCASIYLIVNAVGFFRKSGDTSSNEMERAKARSSGFVNLGLAIGIFLITAVVFIVGSSVLGIAGFRKL